MKISKNYIIIAAVLLVAFVTNPGKEKHVEKASEIFSEYLDLEEESALVNYAMGSFVEALIAHRVQVNNFFVFSTSSIYSPKRDKTLLCGIGIFGQVIKLSSQQDVENFSSQADIDLLHSGRKNKLTVEKDSIAGVDKALQPLFTEK